MATYNNKGEEGGVRSIAARGHFKTKYAPSAPLPEATDSSRLLPALLLAVIPNTCDWLEAPRTEQEEKL